MKNKKVNIFLSLISVVCISTSAENFKPVSSPNPWNDSYENISSLENYPAWGTYNVHDPSIRRFGDYYYMYTTDAMYKVGHHDAERKGIEVGNIPIRRSRDLVNWEWVGWVFPSIPQEAVDWVHANANGHGADNMWAPFIIDHNGTYRLYYCVSAFGKKTSYIGMAESSDPAGPWTDRGCVVKTDNHSVMNAIDPSVIVDEAGKWWMHYGSFFGGLYCVELDPATGLALTPGDLGHLTARRANYRKDNLEAPEAFYNPENKQYYLFGSYDPLMTTYNVRAGKSAKAEGPFYDFFGKELSDTTNNYPILTAPYRFEGHPGWAGTAHCTVFSDGNGRYFMAHQGRLAPHFMMMDLHVREMFFTPDGWPVVSPERYAATPQRKLSAGDISGTWEIVRVMEPRVERGLEAGQILWGEGALLDGEWNLSQEYKFNTNKTIGKGDKWNFSKDKQLLDITLNGEVIKNLVIFVGHDWERQTDTILFTGLDANGRSVWGKRIK